MRQNKFKNRVILLGDWNAQIGFDSLDDEDFSFLGNELGFAHCNENGEEFKIFLQVNDLINISSKIGFNVKVTWKNKNRESQIDHVLISKLHDIRVRYVKGRWTNIKTDHKLLVAGVEIFGISKKIEKKGNFRTLEASALKYDVCNKKYHDELKILNETSGSYFNLDEELQLVSSNLKKAADIALKSSKAPLTPKRRCALNRLNKATNLVKKFPDLLPYKWKLNDRKQEFKGAVRDHEIKRIINFFKNLSDFDITVKVRKSHKFLRDFMFKKKPSLINISKKLWNEVLKDCVGPSLDIFCERDTCPVTPPPTRDEMWNIVLKSSNGKSPGPDGVKVEYIKYADDVTFDRFMKIWNHMWKENEFPSEIYKSVQVPIPKVRNPKSVDEFRRISLCNVVYKVYASWIRNRLRQFTGDPGLHQTAFTEKRSTDDHVFVARRIMEEHWNAGKILFVAALDIKKAFDNMNLDKLKSVLASLNVPSHLIERVLMCVKLDRTRIRWQKQFSEEVNRGKGIKQGCPLSPFLFILIMQSVLLKVTRRLRKVRLIGFGCLRVPTVLAFADDLLILANNKAELEEILTAIEFFLSEVGLEINIDKSKILIRDPAKDLEASDEIILNNKKFNVCRSIKYLGVCLTSTLDRPSTTRQRCMNAVRVSKTVIEFCKMFKPPLEIGLLIYNTVIAPSLLYGTKVATLTKRSRLQLAKYEKLIVKDIWNNCVRKDNEKFNLVKLLRGRTINRRVRVSRLCYYGHILRREYNHPLKLSFHYKLGWRKKGRPSFTWLVSLKHDKERYVDVDWEDLALDKIKLKHRSEGIYNESESEISNLEDSEED